MQEINGKIRNVIEMGKARNYELLSFNKKKKTALMRTVLFTPIKTKLFYLPQYLLTSLKADQHKKIVLTIKVEVE